MKKVLLSIMTVIMTAILSFCFVSCSDKDDDNNPLVGTRWVCYDHYAAYIYSGLSGETFVHVFEFTSNTEMVGYFQSVKTGSKESMQTLQYEYVNDKEVILIGKDGKRTTWYFLSPIELCNNKNKGESYSVVYKKQ